MNILIFSHTSDLGGAERALVDLVNILIKEHDVSIMLPSKEGELVDVLKTMGVKCGVLPTDFSLPNPATTLVDFHDPKIELLVRQLKSKKYDLVIANTMVTLLGMLIGRSLNIPSITYIHECLSNDVDLSPHGCTNKFYLNLISELSNHLLCASEKIRSNFSDQDKCSVLYPFSPYSDINEQEAAEINFESVSLLVIGTKSRRKNTHFAITVLKALRLRGLNLSLHIIGPDNSGSYKLSQQNLLRGEENVFIYPYQSDPFKIPGRKVNLICSHGEPFGLTIAESLARGIPVVASESGGPNEILPAELIYPIDDIDKCVRAIEKIIANYQEYSSFSKNQYLNLIKKNSIELRIETVFKAIDLAILNFNNVTKQNIPIELESFRKICDPIITSEDIAQNIATISKCSSQPLSVTEVNDLVLEEIRSPGTAVLRDINEFDVVPFGPSENMNNLYKRGLGLAIELLANIKDKARQNMMAYIILRLQELRMSIPNPKILCLGDGLGVDSITLASCGFDVHYIDFSDSLMRDCADLNFEKAQKNHNKELNISTLSAPVAPYDVVISLEVIEHTPSPKEFLSYISRNLNAGGLLFISECFDGIYDRWPTHLYLNEEYSSTLPVLAAPFFKLEDINSLPFGKPYLFSKNALSCISEESLNFFEDPIFLHSMLVAKAKIGF
jgi:glycosyltransferase involved in cell wall biosynthesis/SAM-dependent methyltransferase